MRYELTREFNGDEASFEELDAGSFGEFAQAFLLGVGAILLVSVGTYLIFSGVAASLLALLS